MTLSALSSQISNIIFLSLVAGIPLYGFCRKVKVYESFIEGAKEGFTITIKIIPYLVAMIVAVGMFRASGALEMLSHEFAPFLSWLQLPPDVLTLALMRPLSGSASNGILADIIHHYGPDSFASKVAATIMGSTETTFYVLMVYFGSVAIKRTRHALPAGLIADAVGVIASVVICRILLF